MIDHYSLIGWGTESPEVTVARYRRMGCTYEPSDAEIQAELQKRKLAVADRMWAVQSILYSRLCAELEQRNQRHAKDLARHYAERDAGREPLQPPDLITVADGARRVGIDPQKVHSWIRNRDLRTWGLPKHYRVSLADLEVLAAESEWKS
jgi:hypothetical protein